MSRAHLRFQVDSRLATLLSQEYSSSERAPKEVVGLQAHELDDFAPAFEHAQVAEAAMLLR